MFKNLINTHHRKLVMIFCFLFIFGIVNSFAETPSITNIKIGEGTDKTEPIVTDSSSFNFKGALTGTNKSVSESFTKMNEAALQLSTNDGIKRLAAIIAWSFGLFSLFIPIVRYMLGSQEAMYDILVALFSAGIVGVFLINSNYTILVGAITGMFEGLSKAIMGDAGDAIVKMIDVFSKVFKGIADNMPGSWDMIKSVGHTILMILMGVMCLIFMLISLFFFFFYTNLGNALMAIGIALGPIFIGCAVSPMTRVFTQKWLHYLLIAGTYKVVGAVMLSLIAIAPIVPSSLESKSVISAMQNILSITFIMSIMAYLSSMIPDIANALLPGQIGGMGGQVGKVGGGTVKSIKFLKGKLNKDDKTK